MAKTKTLCLLSAVAALAGSVLGRPLTAQVGAGVAAPARLELTTASNEARTAFQSGLDDITNGFFNRGADRIRRAVELDPAFGLARVVNATIAPGLTAAQRNEEISRGVADAAKASTGELLVATAYRENFRQNVTGARSILMAVSQILPGDAFVAYQRAVWTANLPGGTQTDVIPPLKQVIERFPDYAPTYNILAYAQWEASARADAIQTATTYMQKASGQPKSHDTYAELMQWDGRYDEAVRHYMRAIELDPTFLTGAYGLSEVYILQGKGDLARQTLTAALPHTSTPAQRITIHNRIANTYLLEGNIKAALTTLGTVIEEAQKGSVPAAMAAAHLALMSIEAGFGDPKAVAARISHVAAVPPPPPGTAAPPPAGRFVSVGTAHALTGQAAQARVYLDSLARQVQTTPSPAGTAQVHLLTAWVLFSEGKFTEALAEFRQGNPQNPSVRSGIALTQVKLGNVMEARSIRDELLTDRNLNLANFGNVFARRLVKVRVT
jgi:tetratricopeptide (TPR) repeat protein